MRFLSLFSNRSLLAAALSLSLVNVGPCETIIDEDILTKGLDKYLSSLPKVLIYPDWPIGSRYQEIVADGQLSGIRGDWNDKIKALYVPWGCSAKVYENDGASGAGLGRSRSFPPGTYYVGDDFATIISTVTAIPTMDAYLNSADFTTQFEVWIGISSDSRDSTTKVNQEFKNPKFGGGYIINTTKGVTERFVILLPADSKNPKVFETTKAGNAGWSAKIVNGTLDLTLWANPKSMFGGNNWVGVRIEPGK